MRRLGGMLADSGPVLVLAVIAAAGSFTHIRDTATQHGQQGWMAWAIAICIDLTCVMAARERQRDKRTGRQAAPLSWPTLVLVGGILLSLAANLAQADQNTWGWITAATPAGAFLVAVSMIERRTTSRTPNHPTQKDVPAPAVDVMTAPPSFGQPSPSPIPSSPPAPSPTRQVQDGSRPELTAPVPTQDDPAATETPAPEEPSVPPASSPAAPLVDFARRVAAEHHSAHGRPITRDALRARLGVSNQLASDLLRQVRTETA